MWLDCGCVTVVLRFGEGWGGGVGCVGYLFLFVLSVWSVHVFWFLWPFVVFGLLFVEGEAGVFVVWGSDAAGGVVHGLSVVW